MQANAQLPGSAQLLDTLALGPGGRQPAARGDQDTAAGRRGDPKDPMLRLSLAKLLVRQGDKSAAREEHDALATLGADFRGQAEVAAFLKSFSWQCWQAHRPAGVPALSVRCNVGAGFRYGAGGSGPTRPAPNPPGPVKPVPARLARR